MSRFLTAAQIVTALTDPNSLTGDTSGNSPYEVDSWFVYAAGVVGAFGVTNNIAFRNAQNAIYVPSATIGIRHSTGVWDDPPNAENKRDAWQAHLSYADLKIGDAIRLNNRNPYPLTSDITNRPTLLESINEELDRLELNSNSPSSYNTIIAADNGNRFVQDDNIYLTNRNSFMSLYNAPGQLLPNSADTFSFGYKEWVSNPDAPAFLLHEQQYGRGRAFCAERIIIRLYALHNVLYGSELRPLSSDLNIIRSDLAHITGIIANVDAGLNVFEEAIDDYPDAVQAALDAGEDVQQQQLEDLLEDVAENFTFVESLTGGEINAISQRRVYKKYFATTFNEDLITAIPLIQNLYLTEKYFSGIGQAMLPPKRAALSVLLNTINNDDEFQMEPDTSRPASAAAIRHSAGEFDVNAREFILRMLIQTPIKILEGLVEMIDPHMAITKIIKIGSATAFDQGIEYLNPVAQQIQQSLASIDPPIYANITGQSLMEVVLCFVEAGLLGPLQTAFSAILPEDQLLEGDYMPSVSLDGIDFTGTIPGMFMIPPSPIGLLYLLLELVRNALDDNDALEEAPPPQEC